jgi:mannose-6-phosphate isomerase-like protein (cupin superfamily)
MKKPLLALLVFSIITFAISFNVPAAVATSLNPDQSVEILHLGEGKTRMLGKTPVIFKTIAQDDTPGQFSITESPIQPQEGAPLHKHAPETFYVVEGEFEFYAGQPDGSIKTIKATTGDLINIPAGVPHAPKNVGTTPGRLLTITAPGWFQNFLEEVSTPVAGDSSQYGVPSIEKMAPIGKKYGIEFVELPPKTQSNSL